MSDTNFASVNAEDVGNRSLPPSDDRDQSTDDEK